MASTSTMKYSHNHATSGDDLVQGRFLSRTASALDLPELVRQEKIERRRKFHTISSKKKTRLGDSVGYSFGRSTSSLLCQKQGVEEWLSCLELHLAAANSTAKTASFFLHHLSELEQEIVQARQTRNVVGWALVAMKKYPSESILQQQCLRLLVNFPSHDLPPKKCVKHGLAAMRNHPETEQIQALSCQLVEALLAVDGSRVFTTFNAEGGIELILGAANSFRMDLACNRILFYIREIAQRHHADATRRKHGNRSLDQLHAGIVVLRLARN